MVKRVFLHKFLVKTTQQFTRGILNKLLSEHARNYFNFNSNALPHSYVHCTVSNLKSTAPKPRNKLFSNVHCDSFSSICKMSCCRNAPSTFERSNHFLVL